MSLIEVDEREREFAERFRASHHALAMMFAMGYTGNLISRKTGRSMRSLTLMWNDPMFRELVAQKQETIARVGEHKLEEFAELDLDFNILQRKNMIAAELDLADKLEAARESGALLPVRDYNLVIADRADRQGHSKHTIVHHDQDFGARLDRAIARSGKEREVKQIDLEPEKPYTISKADRALTLVPNQPQAERGSSGVGEVVGNRAPAGYPPLFADQPSPDSPQTRRVRVEARRRDTPSPLTRVSGPLTRGRKL